MTSRISLYKLMRQDMRQRGWMVALMSIAAVIVFPLMGMIELENKLSLLEEPYSYFEWKDLLYWYKDYVGPKSQMAVAFVILAAVFLGITGFAWMHSREKLDFYYSLPVRREKRFAAVYLNGVMIFLVPYVLSYVMLLILGAVEKITFPDMVSWCIRTAAWNLLCFLLIYSVAVLAMMLTGRPTVGVLATGILLIYGTVSGWVLEHMQDFFYKTYLAKTNTGKIYSPIGSYLYSIELLAKEGQLKISYVLVVLLAVILMTALAMWLCHIRPVETSENALVFRQAEGILKVAVTIPAALVIGLWVASQSVRSEKWLLVSALISTVLLNLMIEFIYHMDFRKILNRKASLVVSLVLVIGLFIFYKYDLIGYDTYFPKRSEVNRVAVKTDSCLQYIELPGDFYIDESLDRLEIPMNNEIYDRLENILKKQQLEQYTKEDLPYEEAFYVMFHLDNGRRVYRTYYASKEQQVQLIRLFLHDSAYCQSAFQMSELLTCNIDEISFSDFRKAYQPMNLSKEEKNWLLTAYNEELQKTNILDLRGKQPKAQLEVECYEEDNGARSYQGVSLPVYEEFTETLGMMETYGCTIQKEILPEEIEKVQWEDYRKIEDEPVYKMETAGEADILTLAPEEFMGGYQDLISYNMQGFWHEEDLEENMTVIIYWQDGSVSNFGIRKGSEAAEILEGRKE